MRYYMSDDLGGFLMRIIRLPEVMSMTGLSRSSVYKQQAAGSFPKSISLSGRAIGWYSYEVEAWIQEKLDSRPASRTEVEAFSLLSRQYPRW